MVNCSSTQRDTALHPFLFKFIICLVSNSKQTRKNSVKKNYGLNKMYNLCIYYNAYYVLIFTEKGLKSSANNNNH